MKLEDFKIGEVFYASAGFPWLCTDKGTRVISAIMLDPEKDESWFNGPPYAVEEVVFDEYDMEGCYKDTKAMLIESGEQSENSCHPNFRMEDMSKMMKERIHSRSNHKKNLLKRDRVAEDGGILHGYTAEFKDDGWYVKTFELFSRQFGEMHENNFIKLKISTEEDMLKRKESMQ